MIGFLRRRPEMDGGATGLREADDLSSALAAATTPEERAEAWARYLDQHGDDFDEDAREAAELLRDGDLHGLAEHASRYAPERASAAAAAVRADIV
jgi:hypothetical protein